MIHSSSIFIALAPSSSQTDPLMLLPFAITLLAMALGPFLAPRAWEKSYPYIAIGMTLFLAGYYIFWIEEPQPFLGALIEYTSFLAIMIGLYIVTSGIYLHIPGRSTPLRNTLILAAGAILSNLIGTTGASMLLIREWIRSNQNRILPYHIVFFIFVVSNIGGCLTPIGDPPLFLGFLQGVPFDWTLRFLWTPWLIALIFLLLFFYIIDHACHRKLRDTLSPVSLERPHPMPEFAKKDHPMLIGKRNLFFLALVIASIFLPSPWQQLGMIITAAASYWATPKQIHHANRFSWHPIREVGWLFLAIFATMAPALDYLAAHAGGLGINSSMKYYWLTGILSAFLDNAPTYLTFLTVSISSSTMSASEQITNQRELVRAYAELYSSDLMAISLGAVFFGAMTYIGNGPNFMVRSIAESGGIKMPSFFGFVLKYSIPILLPLLVLIGWIFFGGA